MKKTSVRNIIFILSICLAGVSCDISNSSNTGYATFKGKVINSSLPQTTGQEQRTSGLRAIPGKSSRSPVKGAEVAAAIVKANGNITRFSNNQVKTNAKGEYTLKVDLSAVADSSNRIIIVAKSGGQTTKAFVISNAKNGETIVVQPITFESSAETAVYQQVIANGDADEVTKADIEVAVGANVAADIESNSHEAVELAQALEASSEAKAKVLYPGKHKNHR